VSERKQVLREEEMLDTVGVMYLKDDEVQNYKENVTVVVVVVVLAIMVGRVFLLFPSHTPRLSIIIMVIIIRVIYF